MIKQTTIDQVFETARVEEVIADFIQLKRSGSNFKGLSPFTDERTPSFMVSPVKQIWKDFSSGKGGNVVSFLMEHEHFNYPQALKYLANKYGIEIEETEQTDAEKELANERESMYLVSDFAKDFFKQQLYETEEGKSVGLTYFKERGFTEESIKLFDLGYSPNKWDAFTMEALKKEYQIEYLEKTGLTIVKTNKDGGTNQFDRFKGRVIFPIHSMSGRILGFGGRILGNHTNMAKYLNSPESEIYHKSKVLYGLYQAKQSIAKQDLCYVVEGYMDVIQLYQNGIQNIVSASGTALTPEQIRLIKRLTNNVVVLFDGDEAGIRASLRGVDLILEQDMNVRICTFPEGEDPDDFAKKNSAEALKAYLEENAMDFISYKASLLMKDAKNDPIKKAEVIRDMMESVAKIPDPIRQELYLKECVRIMDISEEVLYSTLAQIRAKEDRNQKRPQKRGKQKLEVVKDQPDPRLKVDAQYEIERHLISLLLRYGDQTGSFEEYILKENDEGELEMAAETREAKVYEKIFLDLQEDEIEFTNEHFKNLYPEIINEFKIKDKVVIEEFINRINTFLASEVTSILMEEERYKLHRWDSQGIFVKDKAELEEKEVQQTILNLRMMLIKKKTTELIQQMTADLAEQHLEILTEIREYKKLQVIIARKLDSVVRPEA